MPFEFDDGVIAVLKEVVTEVRDTVKISAIEAGLKLPNWSLASMRNRSFSPEI